MSDPALLAIIETVNGYWKDGFRPALTSFSCEAVGGTFEMAIDAGVMFTLASAGFGIHDDIIDKTSIKHFRKTIPALFGVDSALLAGDLLILKASTVAREIIQNYPSVEIVDIIEAYEIHYTEICEAEFMGLSCRGSVDVDLERYHKMLWKLPESATSNCSLKPRIRKTPVGSLIGNLSPAQTCPTAVIKRPDSSAYCGLDNPCSGADICPGGGPEKPPRPTF